MKKKNDLISKIAIVTAVVGIGSYIYKKVKNCRHSCDTKDSEYYEDDSSFEIILDDDLENDEDVNEEISNNEDIAIEDTIEDKNKDA